MTSKTLRHRYKILSELGKGGFGTTYLATDLDLPNHPKCVVKQLAPSDPRPQVFQIAKTLFKKEAITLQRLGEHSQIPRLFAYFEEGGQFYLVQEFIQGNDLTKEIYLGQKISEEQAIKLLTEILEVLKYVHQQNVIHRDLKPQNIMRRKSDGKIVLIDFGAVKEIKGLTVTTGGHTTHTIAVGTPGYMPSEQAAGQPRFCSDIYAVGMMTIEALTGTPASRLPKDESTGELIWKNQVNVSQKLGRVLDKMFADYWRHRYQTIDEIMVELNDDNYVNSQSQLETVLIHKNQVNNEQPTIPPSGSPSFIPQPSLTLPRSWVKIGLGIAGGAILASIIIIPNILRQKETSSPSPTLNDQDQEKLLPPPIPPIPPRPNDPKIKIREKLLSKGEKFLPSPNRNSISYATNISEINTLTGHNDWVRSVAISLDGQTIVSGSYDKTIKVWDLATGSLKGTISDNSDRVFSVAINPNEKTIISGSADGTIKIWDLVTGTLKTTLNGHSNSVYSVAFNPENQNIISGSADGTIRVWDLATGTSKITITAHSNVVYSVAISPDAKTIVSGSGDGTIKVWDLTTGDLKATLTDHNDQVFSVAISSDGETIVSGSADGTIKVWDLASGSLKQTLTGHSKEVWSVAISSDSKTIVSGSEDKTIKIWDLATGNLKATLTGHQWVVTSIAISADRQHIISSSDDKTIKVWSASNADYSKLEKLLAEGKWKEADMETENIMLQVANRKSEAWLNPVSISKFPCSDLKKIDQLWVKNSNGYFGFTVQKPIYLETGNKPINFQEEAYKLFGKTVGWYQKDKWLKYDQLAFDFPENSPKGHLPAPHRQRTSAALAPYHYLMDKLIKCNI
ncbi:GUN4 domain-containing protein [Dapis sp. BLCC M172]|uniref:GUN4 domain-containing protein n=1 Tax=Dapis sp. BLCC M172 TaxID=2975281 RepID=UPI003CF2B61F